MPDEPPTWCVLVEGPDSTPRPVYWSSDREATEDKWASVMRATKDSDRGQYPCVMLTRDYLAKWGSDA